MCFENFFRFLFWMPSIELILTVHVDFSILNVAMI